MNLFVVIEKKDNFFGWKAKVPRLDYEFYVYEKEDLESTVHWLVFARLAALAQQGKLKHHDVQDLHIEIVEREEIDAFIKFCDEARAIQAAQDYEDAIPVRA